MPASEPTTIMSPSMTAMFAALSAQRGASVADLAERTGLGRSTAARVLTAFESRGLARRERADRSAPDLWFTAATKQTAPSPTDDAPIDREPEMDTQQSDTLSETDRDTEPEGTSGSRNSSTHPEPDGHPAPELTADPVPNVAGAATDPAPEQESEADAESGTETAITGQEGHAAPGETSATARLSKGELRALVVEHLRAHPDEEFTASQVGKALNKSSGAVANSFDVLVKTGEAEMTCEKPRRFRYRATAAN